MRAGAEIVTGAGAVVGAGTTLGDTAAVDAPFVDGAAVAS